MIGVLVCLLIGALTLGSIGDKGRAFLQDLAQASWVNIGSALIGGAVFNLANILLGSVISIAGMSVMFTIGIGLAPVVGVLNNYWSLQKAGPVLLFSGIAQISVAIILNAVAYKKSRWRYTKRAPRASCFLLWRGC